MPSRPRKSRRKKPPPYLAEYWENSRQPLQILALLLPLVIAYELALVFLLQSEANVRTVLAHSYLLKFFDAFNVAPQGGLHLGGLLIIVVLLVWHILTHAEWKIDLPCVGLMAVEAMLLTLPLLVIGQLVIQILLTASNETGLESLDIWSRISISVGAGLYEELMFRMLLIAAIHTLLVDLGKVTNTTGATIAVGISALAFTWYHPLGNDSGSISLQKAAFYFLAGLFFGAIYVIRGFGIVVGVHAMYDTVVSVLAASPPE